MSDKEMRIAYCVQCTPPQIIGVGVVPDRAGPPGTEEANLKKTTPRHRVGADIHTTIKFVALEDKDRMRFDEHPAVFLDRLAKDYKSKLV